MGLKLLPSFVGCQGNSCRISPQAFLAVLGGCGERVKVLRDCTYIVGNPFMMPGVLPESYCLSAITVRDITEAFPAFPGDCGELANVSGMAAKTGREAAIASGKLAKLFGICAKMFGVWIKTLRRPTHTLGVLPNPFRENTQVYRKPRKIFCRTPKLFGSSQRMPVQSKNYSAVGLGCFGSSLLCEG